MPKNNLFIPSERIVSQIYFIRDRKIMLDRDLANLYGVKTKLLNQAVKRNRKRFPPDFMFQLNEKEFSNLKSQFVTSSWGGARTRPYAFTEQGVAMLSSVLHSSRAIQVNIQIMRTFTKLRSLLNSNEALRHRILDMEKRYDTKLKEVFSILQLLLAEDKKPKEEIGFR